MSRVNSRWKPRVSSGWKSTLKFRIETGFKDKIFDADETSDKTGESNRSWWSREDIGDLVDFLAKCRGIQKLRFVRNKKPRKESIKADVSTKKDIGVNCMDGIYEEVLPVDDGAVDEVNYIDRYEYTIQDTNWLDNDDDSVGLDQNESCETSSMLASWSRLNEIQDAFFGQNPLELFHGVGIRGEEVIPGGGVVLHVDGLQRPSF